MRVKILIIYIALVIFGKVLSINAFTPAPGNEKFYFPVSTSFSNKKLKLERSNFEIDFNLVKDYVDIVKVEVVRGEFPWNTVGVYIFSFHFVTKSDVSDDFMRGIHAKLYGNNDREITTDMSIGNRGLIASANPKCIVYPDAIPAWRQQEHGTFDVTMPNGTHLFQELKRISFVPSLNHSGVRKNYDGSLKYPCR